MTTYQDRIRVHIEGQEFSIVGGKFHDMLGAVKQINGRRFVSESKVWQLPGTVEEIQHQLEISGYFLEGGTPISETVPEQPTPKAQPGGGDRIRINVAGHQLAVVGGSFQEMLATVKNLPGRRYDAEEKLWEIPGDLGVIQGIIQAAGFELEGAENIPSAPVPLMEPIQFTEAGEPPPFEEPDFSVDDDSTPFEPPEWLDDDPALPDWWDNEPPPPPPTDYLGPESNRLDSQPAPFETMSSGSASSPAPADRSRGDRIRIRVGVFPLTVTGGTFQDMLAAVKNIPGRRFNGQDKVWDIPDEVGVEKVKQMLNAAGFDVERG